VPTLKKLETGQFKRQFLRFQHNFNCAPLSVGKKTFCAIGHKNNCQKRQQLKRCDCWSYQCLDSNSVPALCWH